MFTDMYFVLKRAAGYFEHLTYVYWKRCMRGVFVRDRDSIDTYFILVI